MKTKFLLLAGLAAGMGLTVCPGAMAQTVTTSATVNATIPDNDLNGLASTIVVNGPAGSLVNVNVTIDISGGYNGDYYAYLQYDSDIVVLLNRLDATASNPYGSPGGGFNVTFSDNSPNITTAPVAAGQPLTGTWAPQTGSLDGTFNEVNPNGAWTLFIADESQGGVGALVDWSLQITEVPESGTMGLFVCGVGLLALSLCDSRRG